jgi:hypothetical protein
VESLRTATREALGTTWSSVGVCSPSFGAAAQIVVIRSARGWTASPPGSAEIGDARSDVLDQELE